MHLLASFSTVTLVANLPFDKLRVANLCERVYAEKLLRSFGPELYVNIKLHDSIVLVVFCLV